MCKKLYHFPAWLAVCGLFILLFTPSGKAATTVVKIANYIFNPTNITINAGDTVVWSNTVTTAHDTTSSTNLWASTALPLGGTFSFTFTNAGYYPYICVAHIVAHPEQTGTVSVVSIALPPTVTITNPANTALFVISPTNILLQASASGNGGSTVTNVQFFSNTTNLIGAKSTAPFSVTFSNVAPGTYALTAKATANNNMSTTSSIVNITVNAAPTVTITNPPGNASFTAPASVTIQASANDDGSVTNVQFLVGATVISNRTTAPYAATTNGLPAGTYTLTAIAADNLGIKATNTISISVTNPPPNTVTLLNPLISGSKFLFSFQTQSGYTYSVLGNTNLATTNWQTLQLFPGSGNSVTVSNTVSAAQQFYRVSAQ